MLSQVATGRGVSAAEARAHEGGARPVPRERHRMSRRLREAGGGAASLRHLRGRLPRRLDGAVLLRRHVLHADAPRVP